MSIVICHPYLSSASSDSSPAAPARPCARCGRPATAHCARCGTEQYCGRACQEAAWPAHKGRCARAAIATITFENFEEGAADGDYGSASQPHYGIPLGNPDTSIAGLLKPDDVVVPLPTMKVVYDYPLARPVAVKEHAPNGKCFSRADVARAVAARYAAIYHEEHATSDAGRANMETGTMGGVCFNRAESNGKYGIWGHEIGDLIFHSMSYDPVRNTFHLGIDS